MNEIVFGRIDIGLLLRVLSEFKKEHENQLNHLEIIRSKEIDEFASTLKNSALLQKEAPVEMIAFGFFVLGRIYESSLFANKACKKLEDMDN